MPDQELEKLRKLSFCHLANIVLVHDVTDQYRRGSVGSVGLRETSWRRLFLSWVLREKWYWLGEKGWVPEAAPCILGSKSGPAQFELLQGQPNWNSQEMVRCMHLDFRAAGRARRILGGHYIKGSSWSFGRGGVHKKLCSWWKSYGRVQQGLKTSLPFINKLCLKSLLLKFLSNLLCAAPAHHCKLHAGLCSQFQRDSSQPAV